MDLLRHLDAKDGGIAVKGDMEAMTMTVEHERLTCEERLARLDAMIERRDSISDFLTEHVRFSDALDDGLRTGDISPKHAKSLLRRAAKLLSNAKQQQ